jgi:hypothetical protein
MGDVDLLVPKDRLARARKAIMDGGYREQIENPTYPFRIDVDGLWERAMPVRGGGVEIQGLSPEDLVLHLCLHAAAHHGFENGFRGICHLHHAIGASRGAFGWTELVGRSKSWGVERSI